MDYKQLKKLRRELHANPEISNKEKETAKTILRFLKTCSPDEILTDVGGHGIIATWDSGKEGKELLFRAELDALPIEEINTFAYKSTTPGVSHKCGHDGHSTILCGLAQFLSENKNSTGKVRLLFQPAEENGEGAKAMLADTKFKKITPDFVFALHNLPGYPLHRIVVKEDTFTASVNSTIINLHGKTSHAAEPENGLNPAIAVSRILSETLALANNHPDKDDMRVITPVYMELGSKDYGISAGNASIHLTLRCWNDLSLKKLDESIVKIANTIAREENLSCSFEYTQTFHANMNNRQATDLVRKAAGNHSLELEERAYPFKWGEDFGLFTAKFKGCMFGIGSGMDVPALHNPDYDFPDDIIETGIIIFSGIIEELIMLEKDYV